MNKEKAINILLQHAIDSCEKIKIRKHSGHTEEVADDLTAAILFLEQNRNKEKKDATVEVTGLQVNSHKGV
tara:strand:- start:29 stop:241 length:213 start_codon:yes stop_codon:yes gene_type:complete